MAEEVGKRGWRAVLLGDFLIIAILILFGLVIATAKILPKLLRWAKVS